MTTTPTTATPAPAPSAADGPAEPGHSADAWSGLLGAEDSPEPDTSTVALAPQPGTDGLAPAAPAGEPAPGSTPSAPVAPPPAAAPAAQPPAQPAPQPQPQPEDPAAQAAEDPLDPNWQQMGLTSLEQGYALGPELAAEFEADPVATLPKLAARVNMNVLTQVASMVNYWTEKVIPQRIQAAIEANTQRTTTRQLFETQVYSKYPELRQVPPQVWQTTAQVLRQRFPQASMQEGIDHAARMLYTMYGWQMPGQAAPTPTPPAAPPPAAAPYVPVQPGAMAPPAAPNGHAGGNPFADLIDR